MKFLPILLQLCVPDTASTIFYDWLGYRSPLGKADRFKLKAEPIIFGDCGYYEGVTCVQTSLYI